MQDPKMTRQYLPQEMKVENWADVQPWYDELEGRELKDAPALEKWLRDRSELEAVLEEDMAWRYIGMNCNTRDKELAARFNHFVETIEPEAQKRSNRLDKKYMNSPARQELDKSKYHIMERAISKRLEMFREENVPLLAQLQKESQEYGNISAEMTVEYEGKELTLQQASNYLKETDRNVREQVYGLISRRRLQDKDKLDSLLDGLTAKRDQVARNAGYANYRDYKFDDLGRFDYGVAECLEFHASIAKHVCPVVDQALEDRREKLGYEVLRPWDLSVDPENKPPLKPFADVNELVDKTIEAFRRTKPVYGDYIRLMKEKGYLDLDSRKGKAPGGFNYPLYESNVPFIFMNATGNMRDLETMMHEGGHAVHSFVSSHLELTEFKGLPSEVAELASMSMELISMESWDLFFDNAEDLKRAKREQLSGVLKVLPWIARVDSFQHWLYENPGHSARERTAAWLRIAEQLDSKLVDRSGHEAAYENAWQAQLHIYEVPFYYIEYGIAQLGSIALWRNYLQDPRAAIGAREAALKLGYSKTIPEIYETAGIRFDFSTGYIKELMDFVSKELKKLS